MRCPSRLLFLIACLTACQPPPQSSTGTQADAEAAKRETPEPLAEPTPKLEPAPLEVAPVEQPRAEPPTQLPALPQAVLPAASGGYEVVSTGSEPLATLRFAPRLGQVERIEMTMRMSMSISGAGLPASPQKIPPIKQVNRAETLSFADGRIVEKIVFEQFEVVSEGVDARLAQLMQEKMAEIRGFEQQVTYDERGGVIEGEMSIPAGTNPQLAKTLETMGKTFQQVMVRLPEQAVGVGAVWRETTKFPNNGIELEQTSEFRLLAHEGERVTLATQVSQTPLGDTFTPPDAATGPVKVIEFDSRGSGQVIYDLHSMMPDQVDTQMRTHFVIEANIMGQVQQMASDIEIDLQLRRVQD